MDYHLSLNNVNNFLLNYIIFPYDLLFQYRNKGFYFKEKFLPTLLIYTNIFI